MTRPQITPSAAHPASARNVISGNGDNGVDIINTGTTAMSWRELHRFGCRRHEEFLSGQFGEHGVYVDNDATGNTIGGTASGAGNVIALTAAGAPLRQRQQHADGQHHPQQWRRQRRLLIRHRDVLADLESMFDSGRSQDSRLPGRRSRAFAIDGILVLLSTTFRTGATTLLTRSATRCEPRGRPSRIRSRRSAAD